MTAKINKPKRIQLKRTKGWRMPANTVKVDRSTKWGNHYVVGTESHAEGEPPIDAQAAVELFEYYQVEMMRDDDIDFNELRGKNLGCWCPLNKPCHADVLLKLANAKQTVTK